MSFVSCFPLIRCWTGCIPDIHRLLWESTVCRCSSISFLPHTMGYTCKDKMSAQTPPCIYSTATRRWGESQWRRWWVWCQGIWTRWQSRNLFVNKIIILILTNDNAQDDAGDNYNTRVAVRRVPSMLRQESRVKLRRHSLVVTPRLDFMIMMAMAILVVFMMVIIMAML